MLRPSWFCSVGVLVLALTLSRPAAAQAPAPAAAVTSPVAPVSYAPTLAATRLGFSTEDQAPLAVNASASRIGRREGRVFALVGGAAVIAGVLIGDDAGTVIAIGGAGLGLYGLYIWQR